MFDESKLWKDRFSQFTKELGRYLRYIFNGHLVVVLLFLLGTGAYYYDLFVETLTLDFPAALIMALVLGLFLTLSPIYTFLLDADKIFLLPLETKLGSYFKKSIAVSFVFQLYILVMILALFMPMYVQVHQGSFKSFFTFLLLLAIMKLWNLFSRWQIQYHVSEQLHALDSIVRFVLNGLFVYFMLIEEPLWMTVMLALMIGLYVYWRRETRNRGLKWEQLIDLEEKRLTSFYRIANLFTDVPKLKDQVKRRRGLDWMLNWISLRQENTYLFLYMSAFVRAGDYLGLVFRLTIIGGIALWLVKFGIGQVLIVLIFLYLTGFQLLPLANHHQNKLWVMMYPVAESLKYKAFQQLLLAILLFETVILFLVLLVSGAYLYGSIALGAGLAFTIYFVFSYSKLRLKKM
ncbi:ABC transporter permease [Bacillus marasmi]|uniref:ABC transporter permease n=1 Tax=Bacillus marasmi TaxID=1926279 RepID=UPI0011C8E981|nr:ABC transporter permease [Bacillus marasmi]